MLKIESRIKQKLANNSISCHITCNGDIVVLVVDTDL